MAKKAVEATADIELTPEQEQALLKQVSASKKARLDKRFNALLEEVKGFADQFTRAQISAFARVLGIDSKPSKGDSTPKAPRGSKEPLKYQIPQADGKGKLWKGTANGKGKAVKVEFDAWMNTADGKAWKKANPDGTYPINPKWKEWDTAKAVKA